MIKRLIDLPARAKFYVTAIVLLAITASEALSRTQLGYRRLFFIVIFVLSWWSLASKGKLADKGNSRVRTTFVLKVTLLQIVMSLLTLGGWMIGYAAKYDISLGSTLAMSEISTHFLGELILIVSIGLMIAFVYVVLLRGMTSRFG